MVSEINGFSDVLIANMNGFSQAIGMKIHIKKVSGLLFAYRVVLEV